jgi:hypothetical protein
MMSEPTELQRRFLEVWPEYERMIASCETLLAEGRGDPQACSRTLITMYQWLGGMSLAVGKPDDIARDYFRRAATSGVRMMGLRGSTVGPRSPSRDGGCNKREASMNSLGSPQLVVLLFIVGLWLIPLAAGVWALVTLHRIQTGQQALQAKIDTIERLLQRS